MINTSMATEEEKGKFYMKRSKKELVEIIIASSEVIDNLTNRKELRYFHCTTADIPVGSISYCLKQKETDGAER